MKKLTSWMKNEESGQGMVEYGLIIALVAVVVIAALVVLGPKVAEIFTGITNTIAGTSSVVSGT